jgi:hypothetical protein
LEDEDEFPDDILLKAFTALQIEVDRWLTEVTAADAVRVLSSFSSPSLTLPHPQPIS